MLHATHKTTKRPRLRTIKDWYLAWAAMRGSMLEHLTALTIQAQFDPSKLAPFKPLPLTILDQIDAYETTIVSYPLPLPHSCHIESPLTHVVPRQRNTTLNDSTTTNRTATYYDESYRYNRALWSTPKWEQGDPSLLMAILFSKHTQPAPAPLPPPHKRATIKSRARVTKVTYPAPTDQSVSIHNTHRP